MIVSLTLRGDLHAQTGLAAWEIPECSGLECVHLEPRSVVNCVALALITKPTSPENANEWRLTALAAPATVYGSKSFS